MNLIIKKNYALTLYNQKVGFMRILPINYIYTNKRNDITPYQNRINNKIQFGMAVSIGDIFNNTYDENEKEFWALAKDFHRALRNASDKLKDNGFTYDIDYNGRNPVKRKESFIDKYQRQGYVLDAVRGTIYWKNQTDIKAMKAFIDAMKEEGYDVAMNRHYNQATGKFSRLPDIEIRQEGISKDDLSIFPPNLRKATISKPRKSTYADWQIRFVKHDKHGKNENKTGLEVIFLTGPKYAEAKELEHKYVYEIGRILRELHIDSDINHHTFDSPGRRIALNVNKIYEHLVEDISRPLFENALCLDLKIKDAEIEPVFIDARRATLLKNYMNVLIEKIPMYYRERKKALTTNKAIIERIKQSNEYKIRLNKKITSKEIREVRAYVKNTLDKWQAEDQEKALNAKCLLDQTLDKYGEKHK